MKEPSVPVGTIINHEGQRYIASKPEIPKQCKGCDFQFHNGEHSDCHAPSTARCDGIIYKRTGHPDYDAIPLDHDIDTRGISLLLASMAISLIIIIGVVGYALYLFINIIIHYANI